MRILIGPSTFGASDPAPLQKLSDAGFQVIDNPFKRRLTRDELQKLLTSDVIGLVAGLETLDRDVLTKSRLKAISRCGSGMSNVDVEAARELGISVYSTPIAPVTAVAELVIGGVLCLLRKIPNMDRALHAEKWEKQTGGQLSGKTVAVIGFGRIGQKVGQLLKAFDAKVIAVDPANSGFMGLDEALQAADIVTLHASGEKCLIGKREVRLMKPGSYLVNAARGGLVDEQALADALRDGHLAGAYLDTFGSEPYRGVLCKFDQALLTPHVGSYTAECRRQMEMEAVENLLSGLNRR